jgi:hypothetical protein
VPSKSVGKVGEAARQSGKQTSVLRTVQMYIGVATVRYWQCILLKKR